MSLTITENNSIQKIAKAFEEASFSDFKGKRADAFAALVKTGLPSNKQEEYRFTPITRSLEKNFNLDAFGTQTPSAITAINDLLIPGLDANVLVFVNGLYAEKLSKIVSPASEVTIQKLNDNADAAKHLGNYLNSTDPFTALNTALWKDGIFIHVPANTKVEKPVFILHLQDSTQAQVINHTRLLVVAEAGSNITILEKTDTKGSNPVFHTFAEEIVLKESATLTYFKIQNDQGKLHQVANTLIHQSDNSHLNTYTFTLSGEIIRNNFGIAVDGENCESHFYGLYLLNGNTIADNHTVVYHKKPNSFSNELYKGVMDGNSKAVFNGKIYVRPHAQKTNAFQSNRNILISEQATVNTKPQLEIWADDVKCSHGCTSGQLDEEALFYLQSRGISQRIAKAMLLYAFAGETLATIENETLKNYLDQLISERLQKDF
jgi:Fe-S cluster assembly protein SufD